MFPAINENVFPSFSFLFNCCVGYWPSWCIDLLTYYSKKNQIKIHSWLRYKNSHHDSIVIIFVHNSTFFFHSSQNVCMLVIALSDCGCLATHKIKPFIIPFSISSGQNWNEWIPFCSPYLLNILIRIQPQTYYHSQIYNV